MKKHEHGDLEQLYADGESADYPAFCEMRSNLNLYAGEHYKKVQDQLMQRLENSKTSEALKLKLVKNHLKVVCQTYINNIVSHAPGVYITPFNEKELQDCKDADISQAVWADAEQKLNYDEKIEGWADSYVVVGEVASFTYWNPSAGDFVGYQQAVSEGGQPIFESPLGDTTEPQDLLGQKHKPKADKAKPIFKGMLCQDVLQPYNIIRKKGTQTLSESPFLIVRDMLPVGEVKAMVSSIQDPKEREEKEGYIVEASEVPFKVFDATTGEYADSKDQVLLKRYFFRKCSEYPNGYFYITTEKGILFEGELPYGEFPILTEGFDKIPGSPRSKSIIKPLRGPQAEINRMASMRATTQITLGQDMVITQVGSKLSKGNQFAGVREFSVNGPPPTVVQGRSGDQFASSLAEEIQDLYKLANLEYELAENQIQDPNLQLYRSLAQKKKYAMYVKKFERFLCKNAELYLRLAQQYLPDDYLVKAIGKREAVNIAEFRRISDKGFNIKTKPMSHDIDSMFGKHLSIQAALQYGSKDMPMSAKAELLRSMPFLGEEQLFGQLTLTAENIENDILALDRGEYRPAELEDEHPEYIKALNHRMKQADFKLLPPQIQQMYQQKKKEHTDLEAERVKQLKMMEADFIPATGALVTCSVQVPDKSKPGATKQLRIPYDALMDLVTKLEAQGSSLEPVQSLDPQSQLAVLQASHQMNQQQPMPPGQQQAPGPAPLQQ